MVSLIYSLAMKREAMIVIPANCGINNGDGTFTEVAQNYGLGGIHAFVKGVTWGDINNDQWPDLFVSVHMGGKNLLF